MVATMLAQTSSFLGTKAVAHQKQARAVNRGVVAVRAGAYDEELIQTAVRCRFLGLTAWSRLTSEQYVSGVLWRYAGSFQRDLNLTLLLYMQKSIASPGRGILAMDESNGTCGKRLDSIGVENTEENRRSYRELLVSTPSLGEYISGAIMFEETLYQSDKSGKKFTDVLKSQNIVPGIKVDKGLVPMPGSNGESWCQGLDGLSERCAEYYKQGARFAKWRSVVSIPNGPTPLALNDCAYGLARYAAIAQSAGLVPIVEPEVLLDGDHDIDR